MLPQKKILLADDEEDIKTVVELYLSSQGYEVVTAYDGLDTIDKVKSERPDLILLDVMMPIMDGFEVLKKLQEDSLTANIPVIMLSAASQEQNIQKGLDMGAVEYIIKPFEPDHLGEVVQKVLSSN